MIFLYPPKKINKILVRRYKKWSAETSLNALISLKLFLLNFEFMNDLTCHFPFTFLSYYKTKIIIINSSFQWSIEEGGFFLSSRTLFDVKQWEKLVFLEQLLKWTQSFTVWQQLLLCHFFVWIEFTQTVYTY